MKPGRWGLLSSKLFIIFWWFIAANLELGVISLKLDAHSTHTKRTNSLREEERNERTERHLYRKANTFRNAENKGKLNSSESFEISAWFEINSIGFGYSSFLIRRFGAPNNKIGDNSDSKLKITSSKVSFCIYFWNVLGVFEEMSDGIKDRWMNLLSATFEKSAESHETEMNWRSYFSAKFLIGQMIEELSCKCELHSLQASFFAIPTSFLSKKNLNLNLWKVAWDASELEVWNQKL